MSCSHILVYLTCFIALLGINKVICCQYCNVTMYPFCVLANVVSQYKPGYYRSPVAQTDALCLFRAADAHCMERGLNSKRLSLLLLIRALNVARSIYSQDWPGYWCAKVGPGGHRNGGKYKCGAGGERE